ncbi:hypothetical protein F5Y10DRAFT_272070 [Nemania abortiva]|nr:hypothetical protein F5Y10DRAFT_272070 [Nemania abortiva]
MRCNVATSGLLACLTDVSTSERSPQTDYLEISFRAPTHFIAQNAPLEFSFHHKFNTVKISTVRLKAYNESLDTGYNNQAIVTTPFKLPSEPPTFLSPDPDDDSVNINWNAPFTDGTNITERINQVLYLEGEWMAEWEGTTTSGNSTSPLFAFFNGDFNTAANNLKTAKPGVFDPNLPAYNETTTKSQSQSQSETQIPTPTPTSITSTTSVTPTASLTTSATSQTPTTAEAESVPTGNSGLSRDGVIGVAVGATIGGLLVAGALIWLFCLRRRNKTARHAMSSYDSDVAVHAIVSDKEIPALLERSTPQSTYGGEGRPSTDHHYVPYSDRPTASPVPTPTPLHHRAGAATPDVVEPPTASQTDLAWTREAQTPTPTQGPVIASRYAHLIEEGMTEEDVRRVEEEERQLDAAIENAGRGRNS